VGIERRSMKVGAWAMMYGYAVAFLGDRSEERRVWIWLLEELL